MTLLNWDGKDIPEELRALPKGRYVLTPVDQMQALTAEEEQGLDDALDSLDRGEGVDLDTVRSELDDIIQRHRR